LQFLTASILIKHADIVRYTKAQRIRWTGHTGRRDQESTVKRITEWRPIAVKRISRERLAWEDDVRVDVGKMKNRNWIKMAMDKGA
jgi:hypothetical protein